MHAQPSRPQHKQGSLWRKQGTSGHNIENFKNPTKLPAMFQKRAAPVITFGSWLRTMRGCTGYDAPLENRFGRDGTLIAAEWQPPAGAVIGPVAEVRVTDTCVSVLVNGWWIDVWWRTRGKERRGITYAQQVRETDWQ